MSTISPLSINTTNASQNVTYGAPATPSDIFYRYLIGIVLVIVGVIGLVGNSFLYKYQAQNMYQRAASILLKFVAIYDGLSLASVFVFMLSVGPSAKVVPDIVMVVYRYVARMPKFCSSLLLLVISIERLYGVLNPFKAKIVFTRKVGNILTIAVSIFVTILLVAVAVSDIVLLREGILDEEVIKPLRMTLPVIGFFFPLLGIVVCNVCFACVLLHHLRNKQSIAASSTQRNAYEIKTTKLVVTITMVFIICVTPKNVSMFLVGFHNQSDPALYEMVLLVLETVNYAINGAIFFFGNSNFREFCKQKFTRQRNDIQSIAYVQGEKSTDSTFTSGVVDPDVGIDNPTNT